MCTKCCHYQCGHVTECINNCLVCMRIYPPHYPSNRAFAIRTISNYANRRARRADYSDYSESSEMSQNSACEAAEFYPPNTIRTARYRPWNLVPKNLFEQLRRIANFYFLVTAILTFVADGPVHPITAVAPLVFVLGVTMLKQGFEDVHRMRNDVCENEKLVTLVRDGMFNLVPSCKIRVGDIVYCREEDPPPCDMILLASSNKSGECFITSASIDGESNLKTLSSVVSTKDWNTAEKICSELHGEILCEQPTVNLNRFVGTLLFRRNGAVRPSTPLGPQNLLLRGMRLKNTEFVFGVAVYTGCETKVAMNSKIKKAKLSSVESRLNIFLVVFIVLLILLAVTSTTAFFVSVRFAWYEVPEKATFKSVLNKFVNFYILFGNLVPISLYVTIEFQKFVGSFFFHWDLEMCYEDPHTGDVRSAKMNTTDMNEELGQVRYLFSDKTGTLTENDMCFRACATGQGTFEELIPGNLYSVPTGGPSLKIGRRVSALMLNYKDMQTNEKNRHLLELMKGLVLCHTVQAQRSTGFDEEEIKQENPSPAADSIAPSEIDLDLMEEENATSFLSSSEFDDDQESSEELCVNLYDYHATSPDERAVVEGCARFGIVFHGRKDDSYVVSFGENNQRYKVVCIFPFSSERRCMSVLLQSPDGKHWLYTKGAESTIVSKLSPTVPKEAVSHLLENVKTFAENGLRTLVYACKPIADKDLATFMQKLQTANKALNDRDAQVDRVYLSQECDLNLLGCVGIEDKLQDGVIQTLKALSEARVQVFVLTGDKEETATNICLACGHMSSYMSRLKVTQLTTITECAYTLDMLLHRTLLNEVVGPTTTVRISSGKNAVCRVPRRYSSSQSSVISMRDMSSHSSTNHQHQVAGSEQTPIRGRLFYRTRSSKMNDETSVYRSSVVYALIVDGPSLSLIMDSEELRRSFLMLCLRSSAVLCCRMSPLQKSEVVRLIKSQYNYLTPEEVTENRLKNVLFYRTHEDARHGLWAPPITAAIGDGANDVSMLTEAHIGFGLYGKEGLQAASAADYAFSKFRFLRPALLVHGHYYYTRLSMMLLYFFYKNLVFSMVQVIFTLSNRFTDLPTYSQMVLALYNMTMTSLPVLIYALTEQFFSRKHLLRRPSLYFHNLAYNAHLTWTKFATWMFLACWHSAVIYMGAFVLFYNAPSAITIYTGRVAVLHSGHFKAFLAVAVFLVVNLKLAVETQYWNVLVAMAFLITVVSNAGALLFVSKLHLKIIRDEYDVFTSMTIFTSTWIMLILIMFTALFPDVALSAWSRQYARSHATKKMIFRRTTSNMSRTNKDPNHPLLKNVFVRSVERGASFAESLM